MWIGKSELKKCLTVCLLCFVLFLVAAFGLHRYEQKKYRQAYNEAVSEILYLLHKDYPDMSYEKIMQILNGEMKGNVLLEDGKEKADYREAVEKYLKAHGIISEKEFILRGHEKESRRFLVGWCLLLIGFGSSIMLLFLFYNRRKDREIRQITRYLEEINGRNYALEMDTLSEEELSVLKTELYKTTVMLKEVGENSKKDKENLKDALSDISHQMKTPLTSILVMLDNLIDDPEMEEEVRQDFLRDIKRETGHIKFLVQAILKLAKLDAGTVTFSREEASLLLIGEEALKNVEALGDLKDVQILIVDEIENRKKADGKDLSGTICCDVRWQVEAVTNILKNCVEHAPSGSKVIMKMQVNPAYCSIEITDYGPEIPKEDVKHLFERFYRGKNASSDGVGIGLPLAKAIVEKDKGKIFVSTSPHQTTFEIKYFH